MELTAASVIGFDVVLVVVAAVGAPVATVVVAEVEETSGFGLFD